MSTSIIPPTPSDESSDKPGTDEKETARVEAFSDGIFAIAITLLILEIKVPHNVPPGGLGAALLHEWPDWIAFFASFAVIAIMWVNHHRLFTLIRKSDDGLLFYNALLLLSVSIVPFPTAVLAEYLATEDAKMAAAVYCGHGFLIAICFTLLWRHAARGARLLRRDIGPEEATQIWKQFRVGPLFYLISFFSCALSPWAGLGVALALAIFFALPPRALAPYLKPGRAARSLTSPSE